MQDIITTGVLLAGGEGTRLKPFTTIASKQLYPIGDKFVIDFPLQTLKNLGVKDLIIVLGGPYFEQVVKYVRDGKHLGFNSCSYVYQENPEGLSQAISLCEHLIISDNFIVILGDNYFEDKLIFNDIAQFGAQIVLTHHEELNRFGVASINDGKIVSIEEKPLVLNNKYDNYAISGLYVFNYEFFKFFRQTQKSKRQEFEILDIINLYHEENNLGFIKINGKWGDLGTFSSIKELSNLL